MSTLDWFMTSGGPVALLTAGYWCLSIFLTMYNKSIYTTWGFPYPTTLVAATFVFQAVCLWTRRRLHFLWDEAEVREEAALMEAGDHEAAGRLRRTSSARSMISVESDGSASDELPRRVWWTLVVPTALCMAGEIFFNNASLLTLSVAFQTQLRSTRPMAVLLTSLMLGLQPFTWRIFFIIALICTGIALCAEGEVHFAVSGFVFMMVSVMCGGARWSLVQLLSHHLPGNSGRVQLMENLVPVCAAATVPLALILEGHKLVGYFNDPATNGWLTLGLILLCGVLTLIQLFIEVSLVALTSSVTFSVLSISKNLMLLGCSIVILGDKVSAQSGVGFAIALLGVVLYKFRPKEPRRRRASSTGSTGSNYGAVETGEGASSST